MDAKTKLGARLRRHHRVRKRVTGTPERPRLAVFRSNRHIYAQVIDDVAGATLAAASSMKLGADGDKKDAARKVGELLAERAKEKGVSKVVFDRGGNRYHGRVKQVAEGARAAGLEL
ncbi:MAG TPA: 50S ribosomal protein L18 [Actinomycetota bacterium]